MDKRYFLNWLDSYERQCCRKPCLGITEMQFKHRTFYLSAIHDIKAKIQNSDVSPFTVVQNYADFCKQYSERHNDAAFIFLVSYSAAEDILRYWSESQK